MPSNLKKLVRARMAQTGESYQAALRAVRRGEPDDPARAEVLRKAFAYLPDAEAAAAIRRLDPFQAAPNQPKEGTKP